MTVYAVYRDGQLQGSHLRASAAAEVCQELTARHSGAVVFFLTVSDSSIPAELDEYIWNPLAAAERILEIRAEAWNPETAGKVASGKYTDRRHDRTRAAKRAAAQQHPPDLFAPLGEKNAQA
jgi:hypothetical protein